MLTLPKAQTLIKQQRKLFRNSINTVLPLGCNTFKQYNGYLSIQQRQLVQKGPLSIPSRFGFDWLHFVYLCFLSSSTCFLRELVFADDTSRWSQTRAT